MYYSNRLLTVRDIQIRPGFRPWSSTPHYHSLSSDFGDLRKNWTLYFCNKVTQRNLNYLNNKEWHFLIVVFPNFLLILLIAHKHFSKFLIFLHISWKNTYISAFFSYKFSQIFIENLNHSHVFVENRNFLKKNYFCLFLS